MRSSFKAVEPRFFDLVRALQEFRDSVVFVGGWLPFLYTEYLWKAHTLDPIFTSDIDLGIRGFHGHKKTLEECFTEQPFIQRAADPGKDRELIRWVLLDQKERYPIDIITGDPDPGQFIKLSGKNTEVINSLNNFDILVKHPLKLEIQEKSLSMYVPKPSAYLFHKGITFDERRQGPGVDYKFKKDLWSIYFILSSVPVRDKIALFEEIKGFSSDSDYPGFLASLEKMFKTPNSKGTRSVLSFYPQSEKSARNAVTSKIRELQEYLEIS